MWDVCSHAVRGMPLVADDKATARDGEKIVMESRAGVKWELAKTADGWSLGTMALHGKPVEQPALKGLLALRNLKSGEVRWLAASKGEKTGPQTANFSGQSEIDGVKLS